VPAIYGVDTRAITKLIRIEGAVLGKIHVNGTPNVDFEDPNLRNLTSEVSVSERTVYKPSSGQTKCRILAMDFGIKYNIIRYFVNVLGCELVRVPYNYDFI